MIDLSTYRQRIGQSLMLLQVIQNRKKKMKKKKYRRKKVHQHPRRKNCKTSEWRWTSAKSSQPSQFSSFHALFAKITTSKAVQHYVTLILLWILCIETLQSFLMMSGIESNPGPAFGEEFMQKTIVACGTCHQGNITSTSHNVPGCSCVPNSYSQGVQCVCNSLCAIALTSIKDIASWRTSDLDATLCNGDKLYKSISSTSCMLEMSDIPDMICAFQMSFAVEQHNATVTGIHAATIRPVLDSLKADSYTDAILFMGDETGAYSSSLHYRNESFYIFDPHSRSGETGYPHCSGTCLLLNFPDSVSCALYLKHLGHELHAKQLNVCPVQLAVVEHVTVQQPMKCENCYKCFKGVRTKEKHETVCIPKRLFVLQREIDKISGQIGEKQQYITLIHKRIREQEHHRSSANCTNRYNIDTHLKNLQHQALTHSRSVASLESQLQKLHEKKHDLSAYLKNMQPDDSSRMERKLSYIQTKRQVSQYVQKENYERRQKYMEPERQAKLCRQQERSRQDDIEKYRKYDNTKHRKRRIDPDIRNEERLSENIRNSQPEKKQKRKEKQQERRRDHAYAQRELHHQRLFRASDAQEEDLLSRCETFSRLMSEGPVYVCASCRQTNFNSHMSNVSKLQPGQHSDLLNLCITAHITLNGKDWKVTSCHNPSIPIRNTVICHEHVSFDGNVWLCNPCKHDIYKGNIPKLSTANKVGFPPKPDVLNLHPLEETLIAPLIPFMTVRSLPICGILQHGQKMIVGNVVHVPNDIAKTVKQLPRSLQDMGTIAVALKRKISYKTSVFKENIRPQCVMEALKHLVSESAMYKNIKMSVDDWIEHINNSHHVNRLFVEGVFDDETNEHTIDPKRTQDITTGQVEDDHRSVSDTEPADEGSDKAPACPPGNMDTLLTQNIQLETQGQEVCTETSHLDVNAILNIAPGEGKVPVYREPLSEYLSFPTIFCGHQRPKDMERERAVYVSQIFKAELCHQDPRVWHSTSNIFWKTKHLIERSLASRAQFVLRRVIGSRQYTAGQLREPGTQQSIKLLDEGYMFLRGLRGSPAYFEDKKKKVMAMVRQLGMPTMFFSLSSADTSWPALLRTLGVLVDNKTYNDEYIQKEMSFEDKCRLVSSHPIACSRYFDERVHKFVNLVLTSQHSPFKKADDYMYRVEFQQRGSPHIHGLLWISGAPKPDVNTRQEVCAYIDSCISCSLDVTPEELPFTKLQLHRHSRTCRRMVAGKRVCRFGMPTFPMRSTVILDPIIPDKTEADILKKQLQQVQEKLTDIPDEIHTFDDWLAHIGMSEAAYIKVVATTISRPKIFLKRTPRETRVNPYMRHLLKVWKANHDIQFVLDAYQCVTYVCDYMTKSQRGMSDLMHQAYEECKSGSMSLRDSVYHISQKFINAVEMPIQECAYYMLGLHIVSSSRKSEFICSAPPEKRVSLMKTMGELAELPSSSRDVTYKSNIDRYMMRPRVIDSWCLADYVAWIDIVYPPKDSQRKTHHEQEPNPLYDGDTDNDTNGADEEADDIFPYTMQNGITLRKRSQPKVIRFVSYRKRSDPEEYFRERLLLYIAWRKEDNIKSGLDTYEAAYNLHRNSILQKMSQYEPKASILEEAQEQYEADSMLNQRVTTIHHETQSLEHNTSDYDVRQAIGIHRVYMEPEIELVPHLMANDDFFSLVSSLNQKQQEFYHHIMTSAFQSSDQVTCALHGGAGTGKSHVTKAVYQGLQRLLTRQAGHDFSSRVILLVAPTGKAAYNIQGTTIHHAFHILPNQKMAFKSLPWETLNTLRNQLANLQWLMIDEFSMVGNKMLNMIHLRLQEIKGNQKPFGGVNIVCIGDLYQLKPVHQDYIFVHLMDDYNAFGPNLWLEHFSMFELDEIMRQKDDQPFAEMLNRLRIGKLTNADLSLLQSRLITQAQSEAMCSLPHFFPTKNQRDIYNERMMTKTQTYEVTVTAIDAAPSDQSAEVQRQILDAARHKQDVSSTGNLPYVLTLKVGQQYDITANIHVEDGLINGTECVIQRIDTDRSSVFPRCVWLTFSDPIIGQQIRRSTHPKYSQLTARGWTPLESIQRRFIVKRMHTVTRQQFPLRLAAGRTIHVSQSATFDEIVVDMHTDSKPPSHFWEHMHYVAFSRCTHLSGLHIVSLNTERIKVSAKVKHYLTHDKKNLQLCYTPSYRQGNTLKMLYNNVCSLTTKWATVQKNWHIKSCDIIFMCETWLRPSQPSTIYSIPTHKLLRMDSEQTPGHRGMMIWIRSDLPTVSTHLLQSSSIEAGLIEIDLPLTRINIVAIYRPPTAPLHEFKHYLATALKKCNLTNPTMIIGDFNIDVLHPTGQGFLTYMQHTYNMTQSVTAPTTYDGTCIDLVFANFADISVFPLANGWSTHHLITSYVPMSLA